MIFGNLEKAILATIAYYDVLDRPLTGWEVFRYLVRRSVGEADGISFERVLSVLSESENLPKVIDTKKGFYFLRDRSELVEKRINRQKIAEYKWKKARRLVGLLQLIPFVRLVTISGSLAMNNTKDESDIDLLIVTKAGRIWTCRALVTLIVHLMGQRRHGSRTKDRLCLNHYLTNENFSIPLKSLYNAQTYAHLVPMWEENYLQYFHQFQNANAWLQDYLYHNPSLQKGYLRKSKTNSFLGYLRNFFECLLNGKMGAALEHALKRVQEHRIRKAPLTYETGGRVVFNDYQLEFHPVSPEKRIIEGYNKKIEKLGFPELAGEQDSGLTI